MVAWGVNRGEPSGPRLLATHVDANRFVQLSILALIHAAVPPPQTQETRTLLEMRLRPARIEGAVSRVWDRVLKLGDCRGGGGVLRVQCRPFAVSVQRSCIALDVSPVGA